jgi:DNA repair protein RadC
VVMVRESLTPHEKDVSKGVNLSSSAAVAALVTPRISAETVEVMYVIGLDGRNRLLFMQEIARGGVHALAIFPRDVYSVACATQATAVVLVHNHPSGDPTPSVQDLAMTKKVVEAGKALGIPLVDHVIIGYEAGYRSLLDLGVLS